VSRAASPTDDPILAVAGLEKSFLRGSEHVRALRAVTFDLHPGEVVGLIGPSGSGKTTLLNVLCGWEEPDAGTIAFPASPGTSPAALRWDEVAIVPQDLALFEELPIGENVRLPVRLSGSAAARIQDVDELLEELGLTALATRLPEEVSLGEQQRAALARAIVLSPALLLADEPTGHQDEGWTKIVMGVMRSLASSGTACLVTTHDPDAVEYLDRQLAMRDGGLSTARTGPVRG
jgi:putative ABC transport system ATP-binding protein